MKIYANMHTHSNHSDGGYTSKELAHAAKEEGYGAIVLTDHDNITGFQEMRSTCESLGLETVLGVEFSSPSKLLPAKPGVKTENNSFHICGYGFDPEHPGICQYLTELSAQKTAQTKELFDDLEKNYPDEYSVWLNDIGNACCSGDESVKELSKRVMATLTDIAKENDGTTIGGATHATPIRAVQTIIQYGEI